MPGLVSLVLLLVFCLPAVACDIRQGRIPNYLNALGLATGAGLSLLVGGSTALSASLIGASFGLAIMLLPFLLHLVGAGDVKFLAAAGAIVGWRLLWPSFLAGAAAGGVMGLVMLALKDRSIERLHSRLVLFHAGCWRKRTHEVVPPQRTGAGLADIRLPYTLALSLGLVTVASVSLFR